MAKRKNQYEITEAVEYFLRDAGIHDEYLVQRAIHNWEEVAGVSIASHTDELWFHSGILHVKMENSVWMQEVLMLRSQLRDKVHEYLGSAVIQEVQVHCR